MEIIGALIIQVTLLNHQLENYKLELEKQEVRLEVPELLERIAVCESNNIATAKNPNSSAKGRFQFIKGSWEYYGKQLWGDEWKNKDIFNYDHNTELAVYVFNKNHTRDWESSRPCWSKKVLASR